MQTFLRCPGKNCDAEINVSCFDHDQEVACPRCGHKFIFFNAGKTTCRSCGNEVDFALNVIRPIAYCDGCRQDRSADLGRAYQPYVMENSTGFQYCGLDSINNFEQQVRNAHSAFRLVEARHPELRSKHLAYLEVVKRTDTAFPLKYVRYIHVTCNFKWSSQQGNAKLLSLLFSVPLPNLMDELCAKRGTVRVYFSSHECLELLKAIPALAPYCSRFHDLPLPSLNEILRKPSCQT